MLDTWYLTADDYDALTTEQRSLVNGDDRGDLFALGDPQTGVIVAIIAQDPQSFVKLPYVLVDAFSSVVADA